MPEISHVSVERWMRAHDLPPPRRFDRPLFSHIAHEITGLDVVGLGHVRQVQQIVEQLNRDEPQLGAREATAEVPPQ